MFVSQWGGHRFFGFCSEQNHIGLLDSLPYPLIVYDSDRLVLLVVVFVVVVVVVVVFVAVVVFVVFAYLQTLSITRLVFHSAYAYFLTITILLLVLPVWFSIALMRPSS